MKQQIIRLSVLGVFFLALLVTACGPGTVSPEVSPLQSPIEESVAPETVEPTESPTREVPAPDPGMATVFGNLIIMDPMFGTPLGGDGIYLVPVDEEAESEGFFIAEVDPETAVKVSSAESSTGDILFTNVPPGRYRLFVVTSAGTVPASYMDGGQRIVLDVEMDQIIDLHRIRIP